MKWVAYVLAGAVSILGASRLANAADLPVKAPIGAAPYSWTGFYLGAHVGYGSGSTRWTDDGTIGVRGVERSRYDMSGWLAGGQIGFNYQTGRMVFGIEAEASGSDINGSQSLCYPGFGAQSCDSKIDWMVTAAGRVGWAFDRALIYAKGGGAWLGEKHNNPSGVGIWRGSETRSGWLVGVGVEYAFSAPWSMKLEYSYYDLGTGNVHFVGPLGPAFDFGADIKQHLNVVKVGLNYRFSERLFVGR